MPNASSDHIYHVYVIEAEMPNGRRVIYVGQSAVPLKRRLHQHASGKRYCHVCRPRVSIPGPRGTRFRLRPDLALTERDHFDRRSDAKRAERKLARRLRDEGYDVLGGR
jgi:predicted GIY-YIG superfamily endonuclease